MEKAMNIVLFGPPGSGKGTHAETLVKEFGFIHLSTGDLLRKEVREKTELGVQAEKLMTAGQLVSDEIIHGMIANFVKPVIDNKGRVLCDGFPRTLPQLDFLVSFLERCGSQLDMIFVLEIPNEMLIQRLTGRRSCPACGAVYHIVNMPPKLDGVCDACHGALIQRKDDVREAIEERLATYEKQTFPVLQAIETKGLKVAKIDASLQREVCYTQIAGYVREFLK